MTLVTRIWYYQKPRRGAVVAWSQNYDSLGGIRQSILNVTKDQRLQVLLAGFGLGVSLKGVVRFGAPVAITVALLIGLGFRSLYAAGLCLIANIAPFLILTKFVFGCSIDPVKAVFAADGSLAHLVLKLHLSWMIP
ncbi:L-lactate permease [Sphingomonas parapaucimobilis]|uniref:L-lactate permease n=1 Tax=Sphingomonas parapaucimobilis TaxID=28213 RepID=UPI0034E2170C